MACVANQFLQSLSGISSANKYLQTLEFVSIFVEIFATMPPSPIRFHAYKSRSDIHAPRAIRIRDRLSTPPPWELNRIDLLFKSQSHTKLLALLKRVGSGLLPLLDGRGSSTTFHPSHPVAVAFSAARG